MAYYQGRYIDHEFLKRYTKAIESITKRKREVSGYFIENRIDSNMFNESMDKLNNEMIFANEVYKIKINKARG